MLLTLSFLFQKTNCISDVLHRNPEITSGIPALSWLSYGQSFGAGLMESPVILNLGFIVLTFSIQIKITIASIIGVILAIVIYKFI